MASPVNISELKTLLPGSHIALFGESIASAITYPPGSSLAPQHGDALRLVLGREYGLINSGVVPARTSQGWLAAPGTAPVWAQEKRSTGNITPLQMSDTDHLYQWIINSAQNTNGFGFTAEAPDASQDRRGAGWVFASIDPVNDANSGVYSPPLDELRRLFKDDVPLWDEFEVYLFRNNAGSTNVDILFYGFQNNATNIFQVNNFEASTLATLTLAPDTSLTKQVITPNSTHRSGLLVSPDNLGTTPDADMQGWGVQFFRAKQTRGSGDARRIEISVGSSYGGQEIATATGENELVAVRDLHRSAIQTLINQSGIELCIPIFHQNDSNVTAIAAYKASHKEFAAQAKMGNPGLKFLYLSPTIRNGASASHEQWYYDARDALREVADEDGDFFIDITDAWGVSNVYQPDAHLNEAGYFRLVDVLSQKLGFGGNNYWRWRLTGGV